MNKKLILLLAIFFSANRVFANSITADSKAQVLNTTSLSQTTALDFGSFIASSTPGTINQNGNVTGGITSVSPGAAAVFNVSSGGDIDNNSKYNFILPSTTIISLNGSGSNPMTADLSFASGGNNRTLGSGIDTVVINSVLNVGANQPAGLYVGNYSVSTNY